MMKIHLLRALRPTVLVDLSMKGVCFMAKYEKHLTGNFDEFLQRISDSVLNGSMSASYEDGSDWTSGEVRCAVRVF